RRQAMRKGAALSELGAALHEAPFVASPRSSAPARGTFLEGVQRSPGTELRPCGVGARRPPLLRAAHGTPAAAHLCAGRRLLPFLSCLDPNPALCPHAHAQPRKGTSGNTREAPQWDPARIQKLLCQAVFSSTLKPLEHAVLIGGLDLPRVAAKRSLPPGSLAPPPPSHGVRARSAPPALTSAPTCRFPQTLLLLSPVTIRLLQSSLTSFLHPWALPGPRGRATPLSWMPLQHPCTCLSRAPPRHACTRLSSRLAQPELPPRTGPGAGEDASGRLATSKHKNIHHQNPGQSRGAGTSFLVAEGWTEGAAEVGRGPRVCRWGWEVGTTWQLLASPARAPLSRSPRQLPWEAQQAQAEAVVCPPGSRSTGRQMLLSHGQEWLQHVWARDAHWSEALPRPQRKHPEQGSGVRETCGPGLWGALPMAAWTVGGEDSGRRGQRAARSPWRPGRGRAFALAARTPGRLFPEQASWDCRGWALCLQAEDWRGIPRSSSGGPQMTGSRGPAPSLRRRVRAGRPLRRAATHPRAACLGEALPERGMLRERPPQLTGVCVRKGDRPGRLQERRRPKPADTCLETRGPTLESAADLRTYPQGSGCDGRGPALSRGAVRLRWCQGPRGGRRGSHDTLKRRGWHPGVQALEAGAAKRWASTPEARPHNPEAYSEEHLWWCVRWAAHASRSAPRVGMLVSGRRSPARWGGRTGFLSRLLGVCAPQGAGSTRTRLGQPTASSTNSQRLPLAERAEASAGSGGAPQQDVGLRAVSWGPCGRGRLSPDDALIQGSGRADNERLSGGRLMPAHVLHLPSLTCHISAWVPWASETAQGPRWPHPGLPRHTAPGHPLGEPLSRTGLPRVCRKTAVLFRDPKARSGASGTGVATVRPSPGQTPALRGQATAGETSPSSMQNAHCIIRRWWQSTSQPRSCPQSRAFPGTGPNRLASMGLCQPAHVHAEAGTDLGRTLERAARPRPGETSLQTAAPPPAASPGPWGLRSRASPARPPPPLLRAHRPALGPPGRAPNSDQTRPIFRPFGLVRACVQVLGRLRHHRATAGPAPGASEQTRGVTAAQGPRDLPPGRQGAGSEGAQELVEAEPGPVGLRSSEQGACSRAQWAEPWRAGRPKTKVPKELPAPPRLALVTATHAAPCRRPGGGAAYNSSWLEAAGRPGPCLPCDLSFSGPQLPDLQDEAQSDTSRSAWTTPAPGRVSRICRVSPGSPGHRRSLGLESALGQLWCSGPVQQGFRAMFTRQRGEQSRQAGPRWRGGADHRHSDGRPRRPAVSQARRGKNAHWQEQKACSHCSSQRQQVEPSLLVSPDSCWATLPSDSSPASRRPTDFPCGKRSQHRSVHTTLVGCSPRPRVPTQAPRGSRPAPATPPTPLSAATIPFYSGSGDVRPRCRRAEAGHGPQTGVSEASAHPQGHTPLTCASPAPMPLAASPHTLPWLLRLGAWRETPTRQQIERPSSSEPTRCQAEPARASAPMATLACRVMAGYCPGPCWMLCCPRSLQPHSLVPHGWPSHRFLGFCWGVWGPPFGLQSPLVVHTGLGPDSGGTFKSIFLRKVPRQTCRAEDASVKAHDRVPGHGDTVSKNGHGDTVSKNGGPSCPPPPQERLHVGWLAQSRIETSVFFRMVKQTNCTSLEASLTMQALLGRCAQYRRHRPEEWPVFVTAGAGRGKSVHTSYCISGTFSRPPSGLAANLLAMAFPGAPSTVLQCDPPPAATPLSTRAAATRNKAHTSVPWTCRGRAHRARRHTHAAPLTASAGGHRREARTPRRCRPARVPCCSQIREETRPGSVLRPREHKTPILTPARPSPMAVAPRSWTWALATASLQSQPRLGCGPACLPVSWASRIPVCSCANEITLTRHEHRATEIEKLNLRSAPVFRLSLTCRKLRDSSTASPGRALRPGATTWAQTAPLALPGRQPPAPRPHCSLPRRGSGFLVIQVIRPRSVMTAWHCASPAGEASTWLSPESNALNQGQAAHGPRRGTSCVTPVQGGGLPTLQRRLTSAILGDGGALPDRLPSCLLTPGLHPTCQQGWHKQPGVPLPWQRLTSGQASDPALTRKVQGEMAECQSPRPVTRPDEETAPALQIAASKGLKATTKQKDGKTRAPWRASAPGVAAAVWCTLKQGPGGTGGWPQKDHCKSRSTPPLPWRVVPRAGLHVLSGTRGSGSYGGCALESGPPCKLINRTSSCQDRSPQVWAPSQGSCPHASTRATPPLVPWRQLGLRQACQSSSPCRQAKRNNGLARACRQPGRLCTSTTSSGAWPGPKDRDCQELTCETLGLLQEHERAEGWCYPQGPRSPLAGEQKPGVKLHSPSVQGHHGGNASTSSSPLQSCQPSHHQAQPGPAAGDAGEHLLGCRADTQVASKDEQHARTLALPRGRSELTEHRPHTDLPGRPPPGPRLRLASCPRLGTGQTDPSLRNGPDRVFSGGRPPPHFYTVARVPAAQPEPLTCCRVGTTCLASHISALAFLSSASPRLLPPGLWLSRAEGSPHSLCTAALPPLLCSSARRELPPTRAPQPPRRGSALSPLDLRAPGEGPPAASPTGCACALQHLAGPASPSLDIRVDLADKTLRQEEPLQSTSGFWPVLSGLQSASPFPSASVLAAVAGREAVLREPAAEGAGHLEQHEPGIFTERPSPSLQTGQTRPGSPHASRRLRPPALPAGPRRLATPRRKRLAPLAPRLTGKTPSPACPPTATLASALGRPHRLPSQEGRARVPGSRLLSARLRPTPPRQGPRRLFSVFPLECRPRGGLCHRCLPGGAPSSPQKRVRARPNQRAEPSLPPRRRQNPPRGVVARGTTGLVVQRRRDGGEPPRPRLPDTTTPTGQRGVAPAPSAGHLAAGGGALAVGSLATARGRGAKMADVVVGKDKCGEQRLVSLPLSRIRVIMKSSPEVSSINQEALVLTAKATELFVQYLATYSYRHGSGKEKKALTYNDLSNTAEESETFQFLADILPKKILASKYLKMLKEKREEDEEENDGASDEEAES
ncbi:LOW QUALITY PROTEIN: Chromatin accessibility complex protein 1, partial [Galemys pyrenaicus]